MGDNILNLGKPPFVLTPEMIADTVRKIAGRDARVMIIGDKSIGDAFRVALTQCGVNIIFWQIQWPRIKRLQQFCRPHRGY